MQTSQKAINLIKIFEGFREKPYLCPSGYKTIGFGHILENSNINFITKKQAEEFLTKDIKIAESSVYKNIKINLSQNQFDALVSFTFNVGGAALQRSTLRQKVNREEHESVSNEFKRWIYSSGIALPGLVVRREIEAGLYNGRYTAAH